MSSKLIQATNARLATTTREAEELPPPPASITIEAPREVAKPATVTANPKLSKNARRVYERLLNARSKNIPATTTFNHASCALGFSHKDGDQTREAFTKCKPVIRELVMLGYMDLYHSSHDGFYYYSLRDGKNEERTMQAKAPTEGKFLYTNGEDPKSIHALAGVILAKRVFHVNVPRAKECKQMLIQGYCFHNGEWIQAPTHREECHQDEALLSLFDRRQNQLRSLHQLADFMKAFPEGFSFNVKCDWRGRFYYLGGMASPHAGKMMRYIYTLDSDTTLDHRSSFAQMITIINGDAKLGLMCGIGTTEPRDLYKSAGESVGVIYDKPWKREGTKRYVMPQSYGCQEKKCTQNCVEASTSMGATEEEARALANALKNFDGLTGLRDKTQATAQALADENKQFNWTTPSGFSVMPQYWESELVEWNSHATERGIFPASLTIRKQTRVDGHKIVETRFEDKNEKPVKSAVIAITANLVQSFDASALALTVVEFYRQTGEIPYTIHDSYTISKKNADKIPQIMRHTFQALQDSKALADIRERLDIPARWIDFKAIPLNPMDVED